MLPAAMAALTPLPHYVAMDIKLPSTAGLAPTWETHAAFLAVALDRLMIDGTAELPVRDRLYVKLVFSEDSLRDLQRAAELVAARDPRIPCILQPVTPRPGGPPAPSASTVLEAQRVTAALLATVRVIPQTHVMLGQW